MESALISLSLVVGGRSGGSLVGKKLAWHNFWYPLEIISHPYSPDPQVRSRACDPNRRVLRKVSTCVAKKWCHTKFF